MPATPGLAINHYITPPGHGLEAFLDDCVAAGATGVGLTERALAEVPLPALKRMLATRGLHVTSVNSAGFFLWADAARAARQREVNAGLLDAAAELGADTLVTIVGGLHDLGSPRPGALAEARRMAEQALPALAATAEARGIRLGLEPMHPMRIGSKSVLNSLRQAAALCAALPRHGIVLDLSHSWWEPELEPLLEGLAGRLMLVQLCGVALPGDPGAAQRRCGLAEGVADVGAILRLLRRCGYAGRFELEIFAEDLHGTPHRAVMQRAVADFARLATA
jgi:sugar phosphate isomerase/epimerase